MSDMKSAFDEEGYFLARGIFSPEEVRTLEGEFDRIVQQLRARDDTTGWLQSGIIETRNVQQYSGAWMAALLHKPFLDRVETLIGPDIVLNHTMLFQKMPTSAPTPFDAHQDWSYLPTEKDTMIAAMIHLSEATEQNGCLRVFPGSNRRGRMAGSTAVDALFHEQFPLEEATPIVAEPGDVTFFHYLTVHGSTSCRSGPARKVVIVRMFSGEDRKEDPHQFMENLVLRGWNDHTTSATAMKAVIPHPREPKAVAPSSDSA
jgi:phytanoyl-CoA hydroxylase